jgi:hypothetical protein
MILQRLAADSPARFQPVWFEWIIAEDVALLATAPLTPTVILRCRRTR